ncbi:glycosyltransferase [Micromonospora sp. CPCC 206061]|uniref:glycosyltransferase n=1 Tax=Micromonospora sp. CPCC 206061 TaxID=3122410 RepID=UPI002FEFF107
MRVGLVSSEKPTGPSQQLARIAAELSARGHEVRVYERRDGAGPPAVANMPAGYRVERLPAAPSAQAPAYVPEFSRRLAESWADGWAPEVVHGHFWIGGLAAASAAGSSGIPVAQTFYSLGTAQRRQLGHDAGGVGQRIALERALSRAVDLAVAQSEEEVDELTRMGVRRADVALVPAGVDTERFTPHGESERRAGRRPRILSVGGLAPWHGQDDVIRAMRLVGDAELVIVGGPPRAGLATHAEARRLRDLAKRTGVGGQVHMVGAVPNDRMPRWYRSADLVACVPRYAPVGQVPLEAMACGVPVIGYAVGGIADTVVDQVTGRLVPPGDVQGLGTALRRLLRDDAGRFAFRHAAVDRVRCRYTWDRTAAALERLYERLLVRRGRRTAPAPA